ncbi:hypothetical protein V6N11_033481 [Hibiscus sabdariffa]|uniref:Uncharacterized protein n=1 Tax=Hibiscus sabdariffa TaxID=183260 RepID=A0ABR2PY62_9ROSI
MLVDEHDVCEAGECLLLGFDMLLKLFDQIHVILVPRHGIVMVVELASVGFEAKIGGWMHFTSEAKLCFAQAFGVCRGVGLYRVICGGSSQKRVHNVLKCLKPGGDMCFFEDVEMGIYIECRLVYSYSLT